MSLPRFSIKRPIFITMLSLGIVLFGVIAFLKLPVEMMPNISFGHITIYINVRGGIPASEVEKRISKLVEEAVGSVGHLKNIISISKENTATIILEFEPGTNMDFALLEVREKFNRVRNKLPGEAEKPIIAKFEHTDKPIVIVAVTSKIRSPEDLRKIVDDTIKDKIQRIDGVAKVEIVGGRESKILVEVNKYRLQSFLLPINTLIDVISLNNLNLLAGEIKRAEDKYLIRTIGKFETLEDIENLSILTTEEGMAIKIKDIAHVKDSYLDPTGFSRVNAQPSVSLYIQKESLANTVRVSSLIQKEIEKLKKKLGDDIKISFISNQAEHIEKAIQGVKISLLLGSILAFSVLFLFLRDITVINVIGVVIPISVLFAFTFMLFFNLTLNLMTLIGLALGVGLLVDNSIVVIEHIFKKISDKTGRFQKLEKGKGDFRLRKGVQRVLSATGTEEMLLAITASTLTTMAVFLPFVFISANIRILYSGLALTICFSLCASLLCALTLTPLLISRLKIKPNIKGMKFLPLFEKAVKASLNFRYLVVFTAIVFFITSLHQLGKLEKEFLGITEQNTFTIFIQMDPGTRIEITNEVVAKIERFVDKIPEVKTVTAKVEQWSGEIYVDLTPLPERKLSTSEVIEEIRPFTEQIDPGFIYFEEAQEVGTKEILIEIFGYDYEVLKNLAMRIAQKIQIIPRFTDTKLRMREGRPEMLVCIDKTRAALTGMSVHDIALVLHAQLRGLVATRYRGIREPLIKTKERKFSPLRISLPKQEKEAEEIETIVKLEKRFKEVLQDLKRITFVNSERELIHLSQIADFKFDIGASEIWRKNKSRMIQASANTGKMALGTAAEKVREVLHDLDLPKDYFWQIGGNYDKMIRNQRELSFAIILSIIIVYMILASLFESYLQPFIILITLPLAAIGVIFALRLTSKPLSIGVFIGAIFLGGIVVNNAIILVDRINFLKKDGGNYYNVIIKAAVDRFRPIIMTSLTTISGMLFIALDKSESSNLWSPLAITVIGGISVSTLLTLFVIPSLYLIFEDIKGLLKQR